MSGRRTRSAGADQHNAGLPPFRGGGRGQNALPPPPPNFVENNVGNNGPRDGENIVEIVENQHAAPPNQPAALAAGGRPNENARHDNAPADGRQDYHPRQYDNVGRGYYGWGNQGANNYGRPGVPYQPYVPYRQLKEENISLKSDIAALKIENEELRKNADEMSKELNNLRKWKKEDDQKKILEQVLDQGIRRVTQNLQPLSFNQLPIQPPSHFQLPYFRQLHDILAAHC